MSFSTNCLLPSFTNGNHIHPPIAVESLLPLRFSQASGDDQHIEGHHRDHAECNYVFHFMHLICVTAKARRPQRRVAASALQDNPGTDGPGGRTGNRAPRSRDQYRLRSLSECDPRCRLGGSTCLGTPQHASKYSFIVRTVSVFITAPFTLEGTAGMRNALHVGWLFLCKNCLGQKQTFSHSRQD